MPQETRTYTLGGVFSEDDRREIESTLSEMKSVQDVSVSTQNRQVNFSFDSGQIQEDFILNTLNSLGYSIRQ